MTMRAPSQHHRGPPRLVIIASTAPSTRRHKCVVKPRLLKALGHPIPGREAHVQRRERVGQLIDIQRIVVDVELHQ